MGLLSKIIIISSLFFSNNLYAAERLKLFSCKAEWGALASRIGGDKVEVFIAPPNIYAADIESLAIGHLKESDLFVCAGLGLESKNFPGLLQNSGNEKIKPGTIGFLELLSNMAKLEKDSSSNTNQIQLNPHNITIAARELFLRLVRIDPTNKQYYQNNYEEFSQEWAFAITGWEKKARELRGLPIITQDESFASLANWLGLVVVSQIEQKEGASNSSRRLEDLIKNNLDQPASLIITNSPDKLAASKIISEKTGIKAIILPTGIDKTGKISDLLRLFDHIIASIKAGSEDRARNFQPPQFTPVH
jgi:hypothetical protein